MMTAAAVPPLLSTAGPEPRRLPRQAVGAAGQAAPGGAQGLGAQAAAALGAQVMVSLMMFFFSRLEKGPFTWEERTALRGRCAPWVVKGLKGRQDCPRLLRRCMLAVLAGPQIRPAWLSRLDAAGACVAAGACGCVRLRTHPGQPLRK